MLQKTAEMIKILNLEDYITGRQVIRGGPGIQFNDIGIIHADGIADRCQHAFLVLRHKVDLGPVHCLDPGRPAHLDPALWICCQEIGTVNLMNGDAASGCYKPLNQITRDRKTALAYFHQHVVNSFNYNTLASLSTFLGRGCYAYHLLALYLEFFLWPEFLGLKYPDDILYMKGS